MNDLELTPQEQRALDALPAERTPSEFLEERVVRSLRQRGLLRNGRDRVLGLTPSWIAAMVAASLVLVVAGFALGRWSAPAPTHEVPGPVSVPAHQNQNQDQDLAVAASLQQAASAYVTALEQLQASLQTTGGEQASQGREVALASLYSAAGRVARFVPAEPLEDGLREVVTAYARGRETGQSNMPRRRVVDF